MEPEDLEKLSNESRLMLLERDTRALASSVGNIVTSMDSFNTWRHQQNVDKGKEEVREQTMIGRLDKIEGTLSKIMWLVITGIILAFVAFMLRGGLTLPVTP